MNFFMHITYQRQIKLKQQFTLTYNTETAAIIYNTQGLDGFTVELCHFFKEQRKQVILKLFGQNEKEGDWSGRIAQQLRALDNL